MLTSTQLLQSGGSLHLLSAGGCGSVPCMPLRALYSMVVVDVQPDSGALGPRAMLGGSWVTRLFSTAAGTALLERLLDDISEAAGPSVTNPRSQWITVVPLPSREISTPGRLGSADCASSPADNACECYVPLPHQPEAAHVPLVILDLELADSDGDSMVAAVAAVQARLAQLHTLGVDVCIHEAVGAVVGSGCAASPSPPAPPPPEPADCNTQWTVNLYRGACRSERDGSTSQHVLVRPLAPPSMTTTTKAVDFIKSSCDDVFSEFPAGWGRDYCGAAAAYMCVEQAQIVRLLLRSKGGSTAVSVNGKLAIGPASLQPPGGNSDLGLGAVTEREATIGLVSGCHSVEVVFADLMDDDDDDLAAAAQVCLPR